MANLTGCLCSSAKLTEENGKQKVIGNKTEGAVLMFIK
jgi:magnesium-transporting ATPase (P-type)